MFDASVENFRTLVLKIPTRPSTGELLVAARGACLMLMPRLVRLATEFSGRFLLVMLNTDELGQLAREHGVAISPH
jgi:putative thioredoxin